MKYSLLLLASISVGFLTTKTTAQEVSKENEAILKAYASYYPKQKTKVLVVGTFHFSYPGLDYTKTNEDDKIDVLKEPKKSEVEELVAYIKRFKPTKVTIEAKEDWGADKKYEEYREGKHRDDRNESYQLGMRIANDLKHDKIYSIDATTFSSDLEKKYPEMMKELTEGYDFKSDDPYTQMVQKSFDESTQFPSKVNILDYIKYMNTIEGHKNNYGAYLIGDFKLEDNRGADFLSIWWYNRNLRMFRKIQQIDQNKEDRILVIVGNGHASVLRHLFEYSPEYDFIEFSSL
ncbi:DUF5694 domain-containing protein [uncultured Aquimarina sp.]|uniref:DUF5694 domain-containing protein n=1 Tax=uncultured Aquimarina sp. TaxID=575652 RepID=UPI002618773C|nr:DUF5694 domain-containing protein [uncultured Aquimarina sp.]